MPRWGFHPPLACLHKPESPTASRHPFPSSYGPIRRVRRSTSPRSPCLSAVGLRFLDLPVPLRGSTFLASGLLGYPRPHRGFFVPLARVAMGVGVPSTPFRCRSGVLGRQARACLPLALTEQNQRPPDVSAHQAPSPSEFFTLASRRLFRDSLAFTRPIFPSPWVRSGGGGPFGLFP